jgi:tetraacyldisaccharide 4'-kinase
MRAGGAGVNPLSAIYAAFVSGKNRLYDAGVLKAQRLPGAVISVGNLSVGGSGKTPFVILLGQLLQQRGVPFDVLSRGYGRKTPGALEVDPNGSPEQFGDESLLIARRLSCPVFVGESRYHAGLYAEKEHGAKLHILDDGFQHRRLARDLDIVLLTPEDLQGRLLPAGRLREPLSSLKRASSVVMTSEMDFIPPARKPIWRIRRSVEISNPPKSPVVFCGIARPQKFIEQLGAAGVGPVGTKFYRDHHGYSASDIRELLALRDRSGANGFITTEKDEINLGSRIESLGAIAIARVHMELTDPPDALDTILRVISDRHPSA